MQPMVMVVALNRGRRSGRPNDSLVDFDAEARTVGRHDPAIHLLDGLTRELVLHGRGERLELRDLDVV